MKILDVKKILSKWQKGLENKGWNALFVENHDVPRVVSVMGNNDYLRESATCIAAMYFMMKGTPFIYQGQEIGMTNIELEDIEEYKDIKSKEFYYTKMEEGMPKEEILKILKLSSRDNARSPMQWNDKRNAGFTEGVPWLCINKNYKKVNVENQLKDPKSVLNFYKKLINIRKKNKVFIYGSYEMILKEHDSIFAYIRDFKDKRAIVICNFSSSNVLYRYETLELKYSNFLLGNYPVDNYECITEFTLRPYETRIYKLNCLGEDLEWKENM